MTCPLACIDGLVDTGKLAAGAPVLVPCAYCSDVTAAGRGTLLEMLETLKRDRAVYLENLTATQKRCTELLEETRALKRALQHDTTVALCAGGASFAPIGPACERGGEIVDYTIGLCSCGECPTPRPDWARGVR